VIVSELEEARTLLCEAVDKASKIVAFTGAGISTECGVPDFRSKNSPWLRYKPIEFNLFMTDVLMREEAWRRKFALDDIYGRAQPGRGHYALANLVAQGKITAIVTQNIDNLQQMSGVSDDKIIELHGNGTYATCLQCGLRYELHDIRRAFDATGAEKAMQRAFSVTADCDLFFAIGSSLVVYPAASFPSLARQHGARLVILNGEPTPLDDLADLVLRGDIGDILQPLAS
jgi:NAD-dependent deacetylase